MPRFAAVLLLLCALPAVTPAAVASTPSQIPVQAFVAPDNFNNLKISPDGTYYAATVPMDDRTVLVVLRRSDMKQTAVVSLEKKGHVLEFAWVNPRQIVYSVGTMSGSLARPERNPYLYLVNADGSGAKVINRAQPMWLEDELRDEDDVILIGQTGTSGQPGLTRLDLRNGRSETNRIRSPLHDGAYYADNAGELRLVSGYVAQELFPRLYLRDKDGDWQTVNDENVTGQKMFVWGFSGDNRTAYLNVEQSNGPDGFFSLDLETLERKLLLRNDRVDPYTVLTSPIDGGVIAVQFMDGKPRLEFIQPEDRHAKELMKLARAFPQAFVYPTSYTRDGNLAMYYVASDVNSGEYYLVDHVSGKASYIAADNEAFDPEAMSPMRPFRFKARDGVELEGFLTVPKSWGNQGPGPLVVMPHGGPKNIFDTWGFDREVQLLASQGYAVLQLNFRGSGNYGYAFRESGNRQWGRKMQDDVTDATRWAIAEKVAAPGRICLYGASYGAYSAMMGLIREPDLYACGIGNVGVYDIPQLYRDETTGSRYMQEYLDQSLGKNNLGEISPASLASRIRVPVLLGAGADDTTAPPAHTRTMARVLKVAGVPVDSVIYQKEEHGYYDRKNRLDWAQRVLAILDRTIGAGRPAAAAAK